MCVGISLMTSEVPLELLDQPELKRRLYTRGTEPELHFLHRDSRPVLPVWHEGQLRIVQWGNRDRHDARRLPLTGWTWQATIEAGGWSAWAPEVVDIPANFGLENGVWFHVRQGFKGLLVSNGRGEPVVYMICAPATRYYEVMTRSRRMPVLIADWTGLANRWTDDDDPPVTD